MAPRAGEVRGAMFVPHGSAARPGSGHRPAYLVDAGARPPGVPGGRRGATARYAGNARVDARCPRCTPGKHCGSARRSLAQVVGRGAPRIDHGEVTTATVILALVVVVALAFDFTNGFHDTGNAMATSIATGALAPRVAVALSAVLNLVGAFLSVEVALTVTNAVVRIQDKTGAPDPALLADHGYGLLLIVLGGLVGGIVWNLLTWLLGLPSSSSHALFGGLVGAALAGLGMSGVNWAGDGSKLDGVLGKVVMPALLSPLVAVAVAAVGTWLIYRVTEGVANRFKEKGFRWGQIGSASLVSLAHGTNDAQKTMGIITALMVGTGVGSVAMKNGNPVVPEWVALAAYTAIAFGTVWAAALAMVFAVPVLAAFLNVIPDGSLGTINNAVFYQYVIDGSGGTGNLDSFLRLQANGTQTGYNTDGTLEFDSKPGTFTHSLKLSQVPQAEINGIAYRAFILDINQTSPDPEIDLTELQLFTAATGNLSVYSTIPSPNIGGATTLVYNLDSNEDNTVQMEMKDSGSGKTCLLYTSDAADE